MTATIELFGSLAFTRRRLVVGMAIGLLAQTMPSAVSGQDLSITFDNSFGAVSLPADFGQNENYQILESYGLKNASNLFHSFDEFGIPTGGSATFEIGADVLNVISRVTGGNPSEIDGRISIDDGGGDGANFWMINPAGMMFGPNSVIDVGGTFNVGAADYLAFPGGLEFSLNDDSVNLLVANPLEFGFLDTGGGELSLDSVDFTSADDSFSGLSLAGRDVSISNVNIESIADTDAQGEIRILGENTLTLTNTNLRFHSFGDSKGGNATLQGGIVTLNGSKVLVNTLGSGDSGSVIITGAESVSLNNSWATAETFGAGDAGSITIQGDAILSNASADGVPLEESEKNFIASTSGFGFTDGSEAGFGAAGTVLINGNSIVLANTSVEATTRSDRLENLLGSITIQANNDLTLLGTLLETSTLGASDAGFIVIDAETLLFSDDTQIEADTSAAGNAGFIQVTGELSLSNGSSITSDTTDLGNAGFISLLGDVSISNDSEINSDTSGAGDAGFIALVGDVSIADDSSITSDATDVGNAGSITIEGAVSIANNSEINSDTSGAGDAGFIGLTGDVSISNGSSITSETRATGNAGFIQIRGGTILFNSSADGVPLEGAGTVLIASTSGDGVTDEIAASAGTAGSVLIEGDLIVLANTLIEASTRSNRLENLPGSITLQANGGSLTLMGTGLVTSTAGASNAGNIFLTAEELLITDGTAINSQTFAAGNAGFIDLTAESIIVEKSGIQGVTFALGNAGNIGITADDIVFRDSTLITAETLGAGNAGSVQIRGGTIRSNVSSDGTPLEGVESVSIVSNSGFDITDGSEAGFGASGDVLLTGYSIVLANTGIESSTRSDRVENRAGQILVLGISDGLSIEEILEAFESGNIVEGNSSKVTLIDTELDTETFGMSDAGNILLVGGELILSNEAEITASTEGMGNAGFVGVRGGTMLFSGGSGILSEATAAGAAGNIDIIIGGEFQIVGDRSDPSGVTTNAEQSQGGNIAIVTSGRLSLDGGIIRASAEADGNGGDVVIDADILLLQESSILARAEDGNGGKLDLLITGADELFITDSFSTLNADSDNGNSGEIIINAPDIDLDSALQEQDANFVAPPQLAADACGPAATSSLSTFTLNDEGGTPVSPDRYLSANAETGVSSLSANAADYNYVIPDILIASAQIELSEGCR